MSDGFWKSRRQVGKLEDWLAGDEGYSKAMKATFNAQTNLDIRVVATLDKMLLQHGWQTRGVSELVRECVRLVFDYALRQGIVPITDIEEAVDYLASRNYSLQQFDSWKRTRLMTAKRAEALRAEYGRDVRIENICVADTKEEPPVWTPPPKDEYDQWAEMRAQEIHTEKPGRKIGYAKYEAAEEAEVLRNAHAGIGSDLANELLMKHRAREIELQENKRKEEEFLQSMQTIKGEQDEQ